MQPRLPLIAGLGLSIASALAACDASPLERAALEVGSCGEDPEPALVDGPVCRSFDSLGAAVDADRIEIVAPFAPGPGARGVRFIADPPPDLELAVDVRHAGPPRELRLSRPLHRDAGGWSRYWLDFAERGVEPPVESVAIIARRVAPRPGAAGIGSDSVCVRDVRAATSPVVDLDPDAHAFVALSHGPRDVLAHTGVTIHELDYTRLDGSLRAYQRRFLDDPAVAAPASFFFDDQLAAARDLGLSWVRRDLRWDAVERRVAASREGYDFRGSGYDPLVDMLETLDMGALFILDYGNEAWTEGAAADLPNTRAAFGRYAAAAVDHFRDRGVAIRYEIYNEPNHPPFWRPSDERVAENGGPLSPMDEARDYGALLIETLLHIRSADCAAALRDPAAPGDTDLLSRVHHCAHHSSCGNGAHDDHPIPEGELAILPAQFGSRAEAFAALAGACERAHQATEGRHRTEVTSAGLSGYAHSFLIEVLDRPLGSAPARCLGGADIDAVGVHPYVGTFGAPAAGPEAAILGYDTLRALLGERYGAGALQASDCPQSDASAVDPPQIWDTEWGYSSRQYGAGDGDLPRYRQGLLTVRKVLVAAALGFELSVLYDLSDDADKTIVCDGARCDSGPHAGCTPLSCQAGDLAVPCHDEAIPASSTIGGVSIGELCAADPCEPEHLGCSYGYDDASREDTEQNFGLFRFNLGDKPAARMLRAFAERAAAYDPTSRASARSLVDVHACLPAGLHALRLADDSSTAIAVWSDAAMDFAFAADDGGRSGRYEVRAPRFSREGLPLRVYDAFGNEVGPGSTLPARSEPGPTDAERGRVNPSQGEHLTLHLTEASGPVFLIYDG